MHRRTALIDVIYIMLIEMDNEKRLQLECLSDISK